MNTRSRTLGQAALAAAIASATAAPALGQTEGGRQAYTIDEVVVTARKIEESLQDVPVAVSAFGAQDIERLNPRDLRDLGGHAPNVSVGSVPGFNAAAIAIRGVSTGDIPSTFDPAVTVAVDGFYYGHAQSSLLDMFDLQQIEILRGPQGTLFGKNTIGGVVNVTSKRPSGEWGVQTQITAGNHGQLELKAAVDMPIVENVLAARFAVMKNESDGYYTNTLDGSDAGGKDVETFRGRFLFTPNETFNALLSFEWEKDRSDTPMVLNTSTANDPNGFYGADLFYGLGYPGRGAGGPLSEPLGDPFETGLVPRTDHVDGFAPHTSSTGHFFDIRGTTLNMNWDVGPGTITSITGSRSVDSDLYNDYLGANVPVYATMRSVYRDTYSQEFRFASTFSDVFDFQTGIYFQNNELSYINNTSLGSAHPFSGVAWPAEGLLQTGDGGQETKSYALFGEGNYQVSEKLGLTLGARYSTEDKEFQLRPIGVAEENRVDTENDWDSMTYRAGLNYRLDDLVMLYGTLSTGFKSGGFNEQATSPATAALSFDEEEADSIEFGIKADLYEGRLRLNIAAFYTEYEGLQLDSVIPVESAIGQESTITNAGSSSVKGIEVEAVARVTESLTIQGTLGYLDAEYDEFNCDLDRNPVNGNEDCTVLDVKRTPEITASTGITYDHSFLDAGRLSYNLNATYTDSYFNDVFNSAGSEHEDVTLLNGSVTFFEANDRYSVSVFGRNILDEEYQVSGLGIANLWSFSIFGPPRTFGLKLGVNF